MMTLGHDRNSSAYKSNYYLFYLGLNFLSIYNFILVETACFSLIQFQLDKHALTKIIKGIKFLPIFCTFARYVCIFAVFAAGRAASVQTYIFCSIQRQKYAYK